MVGGEIGRGGGRERGEEEEEGHTINELRIIVLLLVLNLLCFILFHLERQDRVQSKWIMYNCFITSFKFIVLSYFISFNMKTML